MVSGVHVLPMAQDTVFDGEEDVGLEKSENLDDNNQSVVEGRYRISPLTLTVFKRETENGNFRNFNLQRTYPKDDEGEEFGYTESLRLCDLRKAAALLERAADDIEGFSVEKVENRGGE